MSNVVVTINERTYDLTCNDGQEQHLRGLAADIARRVDELTKTVGQPGEARLLLMVGLLLADELADANAEIDRLQRDHSRAARHRRGAPWRPRSSGWQSTSRTLRRGSKQPKYLPRAGLHGATGRLNPRGQYLPLGSCPCRDPGLGITAPTCVSRPRWNHACHRLRRLRPAHFANRGPLGPRLLR